MQQRQSTKIPVKNAFNVHKHCRRDYPILILLLQAILSDIIIIAGNIIQYYYYYCRRYYPILLLLFQAILSTIIIIIIAGDTIHYYYYCRQYYSLLFNIYTVRLAQLNHTGPDRLLTLYERYSNNCTRSKRPRSSKHSTKTSESRHAWC